MNQKTIEKWMEKYMFVVGIAGQLLYFIQAIKIFAAKDAGEVSLPAYTLGFIAVTSWMLYGMMLKNKVLIVSNIIAMIGALLVITGILLFQT